MASEQQMMAALRRADAAGDTNGAQRIAAMIKQARAGSSAAPQGDDAGGLYAAIHGFEDTATFGLGDKAAALLAAAGSHLPGLKTQSYDEALAGIKGRSVASANAHPGAALAGDLSGIVGGAGVINAGLKGAKLLPGAGKVVGALETALAPVKGQAVRNVAKAAAVGGGFGALDAAGHGGNTDQVLEGGVLGAVAGPVVSKIGTTVIKALAPAADKAMRLLSEKIGESPEVLQRAFANFKAATGRVPTMAELVGLKTQGELRQVAADNPTVGEALTHARDAASSSRAQTLPARIDQVTGPTQDINQLVTARKSRMTAAMNPIRDTKVPITQDELTLLLDRRVRAATNADPVLQKKISAAIRDLTPEPVKGVDGLMFQPTEAVSERLTVDDIDAIRKALRGRQSAYANPANSAHNPHYAKSYGELADNVANLAIDAEPEYAKALQQFADDSDYIHGFKHGTGGKDIGDAETPSLITALGRQEGQRGYASGVGSRLFNEASASEAGATRTAAALGEGTGVTEQVASAVGRPQAQQLQATGQAESRAAQALDTIAPGAPRPSVEEGGLQTAAHVAAAATYHSPTAIGYHLSRLLGGKLKMSPAVQKKVAQYLADPKMTAQGIALLRKAGATNEDLQRLSAAIAASAGIQGGELAAGGQ